MEKKGIPVVKLIWMQKRLENTLDGLVNLKFEKPGATLSVDAVIEILRRIGGEKE